MVSGASYVYTTLDSTAISITVPTTATVAQVIANLYQQANFLQYWDADFGATPGDGSCTVTARTVTPTSGGAAGTEVFTTIAEVQGISGPSISQSPIEVTHMESPDAYKEYIAGLLDAGEISFPVNFTNVAAQTSVITDCEARSRRNFQLIFTASTGTVTFSFAAFITSIDFDFPMEDKISANISLKVTGKMTRS